jgi:transcriptional regulator with XRE-family HTH domain
MDPLKSVSELCAERGLSAEQLAEKAGLDRRRARAIMQGNWTPSPAERDRIAAALGVTRDDIAWSHRTSVSHLYGHGPQFGRSP